MKNSVRLLDNTTKIDWFFLLLVFVLMGCGLALVYSATMNSSEEWIKSYWFRQALHFAAGTLIAFLFVFVKIDYWKKIAFPFYFVVLLSLIYTTFGGGTTTNGAERWIDLGFFRMQPSEFAKIAFLLALSSWLSKHRVSLSQPKTLIVPMLIFIFPFLLVLKQPDLSTALVFTSVTLVSLFWAGFSLRELFLFVSPALSVLLSFSYIPYNQFFWGLLIVMVGILLFKMRFPVKLSVILVCLNLIAGYADDLVWNSLEDHQKERVDTFLDPMKDPRGVGYQVIQSRVAIGSGGMLGKGFGNGTQTNLSFLPEEHTDFIFSVLGEQFGFVGCVFILGLYFLFLWRGISICWLHSDRFVNLVVASACTIFLFHIVVNIAMTLGMMPVTGLPLPFLSYGGSFVFTCMMLVGLLMNMRYHGDELDVNYK
ncbi:MAG: rod shape-determining protein RodA [Fibrobacter sp.]|jgi:rod shape determining protein RodA|nr:rod shape-determining protein RodA [Fibrobacter sp.]